MEKEEKEAFFSEIYRLDDGSEEEDLSYADAIIRYSNSSTQARANENPLIRPSQASYSLGRTISAPLPRISTATGFPASSASVNTSFSSKMARKAWKGGELDTAHDNDQPSKSKGGIKVNGKRKRGQSLALMPESQQIFKGLSFFFFPNNNVAPARGFRIRKAIEYGAFWSREWQSTVTHVIVDKDLCFRDVTEYLKLPVLPPGIVLVNETYISDCIIFRCLVKSSQPHYRIAGHEEALAPKPILTPALSTAPALQSKPDNGAGLKLQQTPSRTECSEGESLSRSRHGAVNPTGASGPEGGSPRHSGCPQNALNEAIEEAQAIKHLPLDLDEDETPQGSFNMHDSDEDHSDDNGRTGTQPKNPINNSWQEHFSCMSKHDGKGKSENPNARTIEVLQQMADHYDRMHDHWRLIAYRRAISALQKQNSKVMTMIEAFEIPFIGERLAKKIEEIVWTNRLKRLDNANLEPNYEVFQNFLKIYGVGYAQAAKWIDLGYRTIDDLLERARLTKNQKIGLEHFDDFQTRIPRTEMDRHDQYVREMCSKIDGSIQLIIGGSYRRGAADSGDVDFIVTKPDCSLDIVRTVMLERVIPKLFKKGYLKVGLATTAREEGSKWHGAAALPGTTIWRRIDFLFVQCNELGAALIYFTGNDIFNRSLRLLASKKGMRLNQRGLYKDVIRDKHRERVTQGTLVEGKDEKRIFELLGVPWRPPHHRMC
ncbi:hypothetical protein N7G274_003758 [Stereocaulon virgatum]|uniref:DNA polymerase lambda n=1 Tax=Stereocaulon virgatum TaxID=373712 RepID=A0ABR4AD87_9LECA